MTGPGAEAGREAGWVRWAPLACGVVAAALVVAVWGGLRQAPLFHDEKAYVLQARLFASGRWTGPAPVIPEFFEQAHVIVTPVLAAKYFPGQALALVPGILLGLPGLISILLTGLTSALVFVLARRLANPPVALLTWLIWIAAHDNLGWRATYFSEVTSSALWLAGWWALLRWREEHRPTHLALVAACAAAVLITRPFTGVAYAIPIAVVVLRDVIRGRRAGRLGPAMAAALAVVAIVPLWSWRTTGDWRRTPLSVYTRDYMPYDTPRFGADTTTPRRAIPTDLADLNEFYLREHRALTPTGLPGIIVRRIGAVSQSVWGDLRWVLAPFALLALAGLTAEGWFALAGASCLGGLYLLYAHPADWTLYYLEAYPVPAFLTALGVWVALSWATARVRPRDAAAGLAPIRAPVAIGAGIVGLALCWPLIDGVAAVSRDARVSQLFFAAIDSIEKSVPARRAVVFVHYKPDHNPSMSFISNPLDQGLERVLTAYDRGADNARLLRAMPDRVPFLFDEASLTVRAMPAPPRAP